MRQLRTQNETNIVPNLVSDSTWNAGDFWLEISAPNAMRSSRAIRSRKHPASTRISNTIGRGFCMKLVHGNEVTKEAHSWRGVYGFCAGIGALILLSISCRSENGASHRKNFDTPPLRGSCKCTTVHLRRFQRRNDFRCTWVHF